MKTRALLSAIACSLLAVGCAWLTYRAPGSGGAAHISVLEFVFGMMAVVFAAGFVASLAVLLVQLLEGESRG